MRDTKNILDVMGITTMLGGLLIEAMPTIALAATVIWTVARTVETIIDIKNKRKNDE